MVAGRYRIHLHEMLAVGSQRTLQAVSGGEEYGDRRCVVSPAPLHRYWLHAAPSKLPRVLPVVSSAASIHVVPRVSNTFFAALIGVCFLTGGYMPVDDPHGRSDSSKRIIKIFILLLII